MNNLSEEERGKHLITVDQLRAAGALDVPPAWRKSLGGDREHYPLFGDDDSCPEQQESSPRDGDFDIETDELQ